MTTDEAFEAGQRDAADDPPLSTGEAQAIARRAGRAPAEALLDVLGNTGSNEESGTDAA